MATGHEPMPDDAGFKRGNAVGWTRRGRGWEGRGTIRGRPRATALEGTRLAEREMIATVRLANPAQMSTTFLVKVDPSPCGGTSEVETTTIVDICWRILCWLEGHSIFQLSLRVPSWNSGAKLDINGVVSTRLGVDGRHCVAPHIPSQDLFRNAMEACSPSCTWRRTALAGCRARRSV